jgi:sugar O-acyltransferase (sialic acid O-acetyltransferase NeuD family)
MGGIVIFGAGEIAELAAFYFEHDGGHRVAAFTVDGAYLKDDTFQGRPIVPFEDLAARFPPAEHACFVAIGYTRLNAVRAAKVAAARASGYTLLSYVSPRATTFPGFAPGEHVFILEDNTIQPFARVGSNVTLWSGNHIGHHSVIEDDCFVASHAVISGGVRIGAGSFVGVNVAIRDGVQIGRRCVIGAGSVVLADAPDESVFSPGATERSRVPSSRLRAI